MRLMGREGGRENKTERRRQSDKRSVKGDEGFH
jgi:hypothetical protein